MIPDAVYAAAREHRHPLLFATVSGAHLYGFPSPDSDWDLRGVHVLPVREVISLLPLKETIETSQDDEIELDLVTHDIRKFITLLLRPNGYVLEQLLSPLVVFSTPEHEELKHLAAGCLTRRHAHHYLGFADSQWRLFTKEEQPRLKPLLYIYRVLLTGIHLMLTGKLEANLEVLNHYYPLVFLPELLASKREGAEQQNLSSTDVSFHEQQMHQLRERLVSAAATTSLPELPTAQPALNDLLIRVRTKTALLVDPGI